MSGRRSRLPAARRAALAGLALAALLGSRPAAALGETCTVTTAPVAFGSYSPASTSPRDGTGTVTVTCTAVLSISVNYRLKISTGNGGSYSPRRMGGLSGTLPYNLYTNASRSIVWGNGSGGTGTVADGYSVGLLLVTRQYPIYGRIPARQNIAPGAYTDTLFVTVEY